jgi:hypothetical protein
MATVTSVVTSLEVRPCHRHAASIFNLKITLLGTQYRPGSMGDATTPLHGGMHDAY